MKYISSGYGPCNDESCDESSYRFTFLAVGKGRTSVKFRETTPSYPGQTLDSWTVKLTVLPRRKGRRWSSGADGSNRPLRAHRSCRVERAATAALPRLAVVRMARI